jgi:hypothetical protein
LNQPKGALPDRELGWRGVIRGGIEIYDVQGHHGAVTVDPHARFLAEKLSPCLEEAYSHVASGMVSSDI